MKLLKTILISGLLLSSVFASTSTNLKKYTPENYKNYILYKIHKKEIKLKDTLTFKGDKYGYKFICKDKVKKTIDHGHDIKLFVEIMQSNDKLCKKDPVKYKRECESAAKAAISLYTTYPCGITPKMRKEAMSSIARACEVSRSPHYCRWHFKK